MTKTLGLKTKQKNLSAPYAHTFISANRKHLLWAHKSPRQREGMRLAPSNLDPVSLDQQECSDVKWLPPLFYTEQVYFIGASPNQEGLRSGTAVGHGQGSWSLVSWQPYLKHNPGPRDQRLFGFRIQCPTNQAFLHLSLKIYEPWGQMDTPHLHRNRYLDKIVLRL